LTGVETSFVAPLTLADALGELGDEGSIAVGGGTSVAILLKSRLLDARRLVYLGRIGSLGGVSVRPGEEVRLGATMTLHGVCRSPLIGSRLPVLTSAVAQVGNPRVRAVATVGGAVTHADPRQDLPPVLLALGARIGIAGPAGRREVPFAGFLRGFMETELAADELVTEVLIPAQPGLWAAYSRFTPGSADDFPVVSVAAAVSFSPEGVVLRARIALGSVASTAILAGDAAAVLAGRPLRADTIAAAAAAAAAAAEPWDDRLGSAGYKRRMVEVWTRRTLESCTVPAAS
jgi:carbon-monoxide dehydrogenase medium subunit